MALQRQGGNRLPLQRQKLATEYEMHRNHSQEPADFPFIKPSQNLARMMLKTGQAD